MDNSIEFNQNYFDFDRFLVGKMNKFNSNWFIRLNSAKLLVLPPESMGKT